MPDLEMPSRKAERHYEGGKGFLAKGCNRCHIPSLSGTRCRTIHRGYAFIRHQSGDFDEILACPNAGVGQSTSFETLSSVKKACSCSSLTTIVLWLAVGSRP